MAMDTVPSSDEFIQTGCMGDSLSVTAAAKKLCVSRIASVPGDQWPQRNLAGSMAFKLEAADWYSAEFWLRIQTAYVLEHATTEAGCLMTIDLFTHYPIAVGVPLLDVAARPSDRTRHDDG